MPESLPLPFSLNAAVDAFESLLENDQACCIQEISSFLPAVNHFDYSNTLVELVRIDLEYGWSRGTPKLLDEYFQYFPELKQQPKLLDAVCFEEHRQKILAGHASDPLNYQAAYGVKVASWRLSHGGPTTTSRPLDDDDDKKDGLPSVGESFLGFELIAELGRGSFARVFLARQTSLSNRMVALKVTRNRYSDSRTLARLQHTNIIPVYSVQQHGNWEAICMPYFGALTVNHLLSQIRRQPSLPPSGKFIHDTVIDVRKETLRDVHDLAEKTTSTTETEETLPTLSSVDGFHALCGLPYAKSVLFIAKKLASGLAYAHARGIVHGDLKPANLLLSDDGEPMILDFNLSVDLMDRTSSSDEYIGGTLPYMAPEQLRNFQNQSKNIGDPRSDLFSLGIVLYELLVGKSPYAVHHGDIGEVIARSLADRQDGPRPILDREATVSPAMESILAKCLAPRVEERYQSAQSLVDDLECQLNDLPLRHASERSLRERTQKWIRRHPRVVSGSGVLSIATVLLLAMVSLLAIRNERLATFESQVTWQKFQERVRDAKVKVITASIAESSVVNETIANCDEALGVYEVDASNRWKTLPSVEKLPSEQRHQLSRDVADLLFQKATTLGLMADFATDSLEKTRILNWALQVNDLARECYPDTAFGASLDRQAKWLRQEPISVDETFSHSDLANASTRSICEQASLLSVQRRFREASHLWQTASMRDPQNLSIWHGLGHSLEQVGLYARAAECYSVCLSLNPDNFIWYFNRGITRMKTKEFELAVADFSRAIELKGGNSESHINRAISLLELNECHAALADIREAIQFGFEDPQAYRLLAQANSGLGDRQAADIAIAKANDLMPKSAASWVARGVTMASANPEQAIDAFNNALKLNVHHLAALESKASVLAETMGKTDESIAVLSEAVRLFPEAAEILAIRGVLHARLSHLAMAIDDAQHALHLDASPAIVYRVAGIYALLSADSRDNSRHAIDLLAASLKAGYGSDLLDADPDLERLRALPEFREIREAAAIIHKRSLHYSELE